MASLPRRLSAERVIFKAQPITTRIASERRLTLLWRGIEASSNGISIADATREDEPLIYVNPAFERITGYHADEVLGRNCRFLQGQGFDRAAGQKIREALDVQKDIRVVVKNTKKDGEVFWNDLFIAPVPDERGEVTHFIGIQNDISDRKSAESALAYNVSRDALTGLPNRSLLEDRLRQGRKLAFRHNRQLAGLYVNLDDFKLINDSLGYSAGDQILIEVAQRLKSLVQTGSTVARLYADEFCILLPDLDSAESAIKMSDTILSALTSPFRITNALIHVTASIGLPPLTLSWRWWNRCC